MIPYTNLGYKVHFRKEVGVLDIQKFILKNTTFSKKPLNYYPNGYFVNEDNNQATEIIINETYMSMTKFADHLLIRPKLGTLADINIIFSYKLIEEFILKLYDNFDVYITSHINGSKLTKSKFHEDITGFVAQFKRVRKNSKKKEELEEKNEK